MSKKEKVVQHTETDRKEEKPADDVQAQEKDKQAAGVKEKGEQDAEAKAQPEDDLQDKYLRLMAEYQNFRNRTAKERKDIYAFANEKIVVELLDVIDSFERAMDARTEGDKFAEGMELILKQLQSVLEKNGLKEIEALGKPFDPNFHNAVMTEASEDVVSGTVTKVLQKGYLLNEKVIRPSMVGVSQ